MSSLSQRIEANRRTAEAFLAGTHSADIDDVEIIDETVAESIVCHGFPGGDPHDRESYKNFFRTFRQSFSGMKFTIEALAAGEDHVSARWRIQARHTGAFAGVEADGRQVDFGGIVLYRLESARIVETWLQIDELSLLSQIGAVTARAA